MKIQNSYNNQSSKTQKQHINRNKNNKKPTQNHHRNYQQKKTPLPLIKINGQFKSTNPLENTHQANQNQSNLLRNSYQKNLNQQKINKTPLLMNQNDLALYSKTHKIQKKKINFQINYNNIQKQYKQFGNLFVHALTKLSCDQRFVQVQEQDPVNRNFPEPIVNIFYGQNVHKYNPYIEVLDRLYESFRGKVSKQMMEKIKKLCYIGLARSHLKSQKYSQTPKYRRVNILIRTYMYENMRSIIEQKAQNYENIVFIPCNKDAMSFSHRQFPKQLASICRRQSFQYTIQNVNRIIEEHYISYKQMNTKQTVTDRWGQNLCYLLTVLFLVILILSDNIVFVYILAFFIIVSLVLYLYETRQTLSMLGTSKNIIQKIQNSLQSYLSQINTHNMEWKVGEDFYWLQIHYIKKMKKKPFKHNQQ